MGVSAFSAPSAIKRMYLEGSMANINDLHGKEAYIEAYRREAFSNFVQQRADAMRRRRELIALACAVLTVIAIAAVILSSPSSWWLATPWDER
jgi:hypothetical protein